MSSVEFYRAEPTPITSWRMAVLMGANARTYKFALGASLLHHAREGRDAVSLRELATPYALALAERSERFPQGPPSSVRGPGDFLTVLADERDATVATRQPSERLIEAAVRSMPAMVMQKFHNLRGVGEVEHRFYRVDGGARDQVVLEPNLLAAARHGELLSDELAARWSIVEACFDAEIGRSLVQAGVLVSEDGTDLISVKRRAPVARARPALTGFQHGRCFYCHEELSPAAGSVHVDHVFPYALMRSGAWSDGPDLNGVWNLVVACAACNLTKSSRTPTAVEVAALAARNERIMTSPHPLKRTLELSMTSEGAAASTTEESRAGFLRAVQSLASDRGLA
jgi:5-methylcytosine-specific restriction endonuclease McrA